MWVVFKKTPKGERYWNGNLDKKGDEPLSCDNCLEAIKFPTARSAYENAGRYSGLLDWRVGRVRG